MKTFETFTVRFRPGNDVAYYLDSELCESGHCARARRGLPPGVAFAARRTLVDGTRVWVLTAPGYGAPSDYGIGSISVPL